MRVDDRKASLFVRPLIRWLSHGLTAVAIVFACTAHARDFPQNALRGTVKAFAYPKVQIGKMAYHMTPASKIFNAHNLIIMPAAMPPTAEVMFSLDMNGHIRSIWLLTPEEIDRLGRASTKPTAPR